MFRNKVHIVSTLAAFYLIALTSLVGTIGSVKAAGVAVSVAPSALTSASATDVVFSYSSSTTEYAIGNTISIEAAAGVTIANTCTSPTTDADTDATPDGSGAVVGQIYTYTFSAATTTAVSGGVDFCVKLTASTGNYSLVFTDSKTVSANNDYGGALIYVGSANVVNVSAQVQPALSFVIRNSADTGNTNACALGTLTLTAVNTCAYRLKITTNSPTGYTVQVNSDGDLRKSGSGDVADNLEIDLVAENATVSSGTEAYGVALTGGSITGGTVTESGDFADDDTPLPISTPTTFFTGSGTNNPTSTDTTNTSLVTHRAAMDGDTTTGLYTQLVTYTVSATF
jgi:hypothetical protein